MNSFIYDTLHIDVVFFLKQENKKTTNFAKTFSSSPFKAWIVPSYLIYVSKWLNCLLEVERGC
jgi:hypothetical protein